MTKQEVKEVFKDCEALKGTERRGECFVDFAAVWRGEQDSNRPSGLVVWIVGAATAAVALAATIIILIFI